MAKPQKIKSGNYWRGVSVVLSDYFQTTTKLVLQMVDDPEELNFINGLLGDAISLLNRDGSVDMRYDGSLDKNRKKVGSVMMGVLLFGADKFKKAGSPKPSPKISVDVVEGTIVRTATPKLIERIEKEIIGSPHSTSWVFTHGSSRFRVVMIEKGVADVMEYHKTADYWDVRFQIDIKVEE